MAFHPLNMFMARIPNDFNLYKCCIMEMFVSDKFLSNFMMLIKKTGSYNV